MFRIQERASIPKQTRGEALLNAGYPADALPFVLRDVELQPKNPGHWNNLGSCWKFIGIYDQAVSAYQRAIDLCPEAGQPYHNLALAREEMGEFEQAKNLYFKALSIHNSPETRYGLAGCLLREGLFDLAAPIWNGARLEKNSYIIVPNIRVWTGEPLAGQSVLVTREGGYGDIIWLLRYCGRLKELGARVTLQAYNSLRPLLEGNPLIDWLITSDDGIDEALFDYQVPMWSIMFVLKEIPLPMTAPYIDVDGPGPEAYRSQSERPRVGICWEAGECLSVHRKMRSIQPELLHQFSSVPVDWVSLVPGCTPDWCVSGVGDSKDWALTASTIKGLDMVVAADSSVAHLAGAMSKPLIVFAPKNVDWKYSTSYDSGKWYPSAKVLINTDPVSFQPVVDMIKSEVAAWLAEREVAACR